jgi:hypothetical protein
MSLYEIEKFGLLLISEYDTRSPHGKLRDSGKIIHKKTITGEE